MFRCVVGWIVAHMQLVEAPRVVVFPLITSCRMTRRCLERHDKVVPCPSWIDFLLGEVRSLIGDSSDSLP